MKRNPNFKKTVFDNGLTVVSERHPEFRSLSIGAWIKVGTRHESKSEMGVSHFLEHMLFKGTKKRSALDIALEVDRVGGDFNAFTSRENTCFHVLLLDRDMGLGLDILSDAILNSTFVPAELERERKVILQEISMVDESPEEIAHDVFFEKLYDGHGLGRPILGTERSISRLERRRVLSYFRNHYRPDQVVISVAGNVSHESVVRKISALARGRWPGRPRVATPSEFVRAPTPQLGRWWEVRDTEQAHLLWGVRGPNYSSQDRFTAYLLNLYLGGGMSSELFQNIREKHGLAYNVYSSLTPFTDTGVFSIYAATAPVQLPLCLRLIEESVGKLKERALDRKTLDAIKDSLKGTILISSDGAEARMTSIAHNEMTFGRYVPVEEVCRDIDRITPDDIQSLANRIFKDERRALLVLAPRPTPGVKKKLGFAAKGGS